MQVTPAYFKKQLRKELVMVKKYYVPTLFATIPAHQVSHMRWPDCQGMEDIMARFLNHCVNHSPPCLYMVGASASTVATPRGHSFFSDCSNRYLALLVSGCTTAYQERPGPCKHWAIIEGTPFGTALLGLMLL
jgi:hypothetical protein